MKTYSVTYWQEHWEELIERVQGGEDICVTNEKGNTAVMSSAVDEIVRVHQEHNEAC